MSWASLCFLRYLPPSKDLQKSKHLRIGEVCYQPWVTKTGLKFLTKMKGKLDKIPNIVKCLSEKKVKQATFQKIKLKNN